MNTHLKNLVGSAGKAVAGAVGTVAGIAAGTAAAIAGKNAPVTVDAANEELYWREHFAAEPYYDANFTLEDYLPAWRTGWEGRARHGRRRFEDAEQDLQAEFHWNRGQSRLLWEQARDAVRAAFEHAT
jgi:hypothetical protein